MLPTQLKPSGANPKTGLDQLAVAGGDAAFRDIIHVGRPNIGDRERLAERIDDLLNRRWLTNNGQYVQEFERRVADRLGAQHVVAVCNGTVALEIAIRALELSGEVIVPSFTFAATVHALRWLGITPVFCDVDAKSHTLDHRRVEQVITPRTTGMLAVHLWGGACDVDELSEIAARRKLKLLFDAAHGFSCSYKGRMIGNFGDAEVLSFHATKVLNTFEGGAIVTNDDGLAARLRLMRNLGFRTLDDVVTVGTNGKMSEVCAAMGLTGLESVDQFIRVNYDNYCHYRHALGHLRGVSMMSFGEDQRSNYQYIVLEIDEAEAGLSRDDLMHVLHAENIRARRYFFPGCHRMAPYRDLYPDAGRFLRETERLTTSVLCLPTGTGLDSDDIEAICCIIRVALTHADEIRSLLAGQHQFLGMRDEQKR
jgi:dTDP-4-amino-4,6-dideoxygalactose transaminase